MIMHKFNFIFNEVFNFKIFKYIRDQLDTKLKIQSLLDTFKVERSIKDKIESLKITYWIYFQV